MEIQESLHEIAALLLEFHEEYLKHVVGVPNILYSLLGLSQAVNLLGNGLTIADIEFRRLQLCGNEMKSEMSYDQFYNWLRSVSLDYYSTCTSDAEAFHRVLIDKILPVATAGLPENIAIAQDLVQNPASVRRIWGFVPFIRFLFASLTNTLQVVVIS